MATHTRPDAAPLYEVHRRWLTETLPNGDSLITPGTEVWTSDHLDELERSFVGQPDLTKDKKFLEKLRDQLRGCSPGAVQLMAELHVVHFLHVWQGAISPAKKRSDIETILSWMPVSPPLPTALIDTLGPGLIHPGQWVLSRRDTQLTWLIHFSIAWRGLDTHEKARLAQGPWALKAFVNEVEAPSAESARLAMLHMTCPDQIEPITSAAHKDAIAARFADLDGGETDIDRRLVAIRTALSPAYGEGFDWYQDELDRRWSRNAKPWRDLMMWVQRFWDVPEFDADERDFKLELAKLISGVRLLVDRDDPGWPEALKRTLRSPLNSITRYTVHDRFLRWVGHEPGLARRSLLAIWAADLPPWVALDGFVAAVRPDVLVNRGERINLGSFLLMGSDPQSLPPMKVSALRQAYRLLGWARDGDDLTDGQAYRRGLVLFEEVHHESKSWATPLRDPLDAQGALWSMLKYQEPPAGWSPELWQELLAYRTTSIDPDDPRDPDDDPQTEAASDSGVGTTNVDHLAAAAADLNLDRTHLDEIVRLLEDKDQVVLYGPPGTGKTFLALRLARAIAEGDESRVSLVQFHPHPATRTSSRGCGRGSRTRAR